MNSDTHADSGQGQRSDGGQGSIKGRYYPVRGGSSSNWNQTNDPWRPTASGAAVGRGLGDVSPRRRANFQQGGAQYGSGGTRSSPKSSDSLYGPGLAPPGGADGPDGSGNGTTHQKHDWFARNKNMTGSGCGDISTSQTSNSNAGGLSNTVPYGSSAVGSKGRGGKVSRTGK